MQRTVYDLQVDGSNVERQIAEKELEIQILRAKLAELNVEYRRATESNVMRQRDEAHAKLAEKAQVAPVAEAVPVAPVVATPPAL